LCPAQPVADVEKWAVLELGGPAPDDWRWGAMQLADSRLDLVAAALCKPDEGRFAERSFAALEAGDAPG
jgi:hypothetical protein